MDLEELLYELTGLLDQQGLRWALIGGLALGVYGVGRQTSDVDFVVDREQQRALIEKLEESGFETLHASGGYSNHIRGRDRVDFVYVNPKTAAQLFADARQFGVGRRQLRVVSPEHLAAMKVLAMKNDPDRLVGELADVEMILKLPDVDRSSIQLQFRRHGLEDLFQQLLDRLPTDR